MEQVRTSIWREEAEPADRFATRAAHCRGYDVYGDMLGRARWVDMLWLLFREEAPTEAQARLLEALAVALANAGPRDAAVHAAMCSGLGRSPAAAALMAALAVGAGRHGGAQEVAAAMTIWDGRAAPESVALWVAGWLSAAAPTSPIWPEADHPPGFEPNGVVTPGIVCNSLQRLANIGGGPRLRWLAGQRAEIEAAVGLPLAMSGVAAAALGDLGFTPEQGEMLHLLLRLPGAAAHALEQRAGSYKDFPFFALDLQDDPQNLDPAADRSLLGENLVASAPDPSHDVHHSGDQRCTPAGLALRAAGGVASPCGQGPTASSRLASHPPRQPLGRAQLPNLG